MPAGFRVLDLISGSKAHLDAVQENYFEHLRFASTVAAMLAAAAVACLLHALIPAVCTGTASRTIRQLNALLADRELLDRTASEAGAAIGFTFLLAVSLAVAVTLWLAGAAAVMALPLTLIAFALPLAALAANPELAAEPAHA
jgi:hypothetical protein